MKIPFESIAFGAIIVAGILGCDGGRGSASSGGGDPLAEIEQKLDGIAGRQIAAAETAYENWYPNDISPPPGTRYPCTLTALPRDLVGVPAADRGFINHTYTMILRLTQAKLILFKSFADRSEIPRIAAAYRDSNRKVYERIGAEEAPPHLESFRRAVLRAIDLHLQWSGEAASIMIRGGNLKSAQSLSSGKEASTELRSAWSEMRRLYPEMDRATKNSIEHHLCALDLF